MSDSWDSYISKLSLDYEVFENVKAYALYPEYFKSGAFQPEEPTNFEIGLKGASGFYRYAVTLFDITLDDVQTLNQVPIGNDGAFFGAISHVGEISTTGI